MKCLWEIFSKRSEGTLHEVLASRHNVFLLRLNQVVELDIVRRLLWPLRKVELDLRLVDLLWSIFILLIVFSTSLQ